MVTQTARVEGLNGEVQVVQLRMPLSLALMSNMVRFCMRVTRAVANRPRLSDVFLAKNNVNNEVHNQAFGNLSKNCRRDVNRIKGNNKSCTRFSMCRADADRFSDSALELIGRYMLNNNRLKDIGLGDLRMDDSRMKLLFQELTGSKSVESLSFYIRGVDREVVFGAEAISDMVPFLKNAPKLSYISLSGNEILTEGFELLVNALDGGSITQLLLDECKIDDISALEECTLPRLFMLHLSGNCITSIPSLKNHKSLGWLTLSNNKIEKPILGDIGSLDHICLDGNGINDKDVEVLADSLHHNTSLHVLSLENNPFTERGLCALLRLLNNVSSIGSTLQSNHTLKSITVPHSIGDFTIPRPEPNSADDTPARKELRKHIKDATRINSNSSNHGRDKVIQTQLNSTKRYELACFQGTSESLFSDDDTFLLPEILALVGEEYGHNDLYQLLIEVVPYLMSSA